MDLVKRNPLSAARIAANRRNAQKSTGPRTARGKSRAALNSFKHGRYASVDTRWREALRRGGHDPGEYDQLHQDMYEAWQPADAMQRILVEDLTSLYWRKIQRARDQADDRLRQISQWEQEREKRALEAQSDDGYISDSEVAVCGYRGSGDCWKKFDMTEELLDSLRERAECRAWSEGVKEIFGSLYGLHPTRRGRWMMQRFERLAHGKAGQAPDPAACEELLKWIDEEKQDVAKERILFERRQQRLSGTGDAQELPPETTEWLETISPDTELDRLIESKVRLLMQLQSRGKRGRPRPARRRRAQAA